MSILGVESWVRSEHVNPPNPLKSYYTPTFTGARHTFTWESRSVTSRGQFCSSTERIKPIVERFFSPEHTLNVHYECLCILLLPIGQHHHHLYGLVPRWRACILLWLVTIRISSPRRWHAGCEIFRAIFAEIRGVALLPHPTSSRRSLSRDLWDDTSKHTGDPPTVPYHPGECYLTCPSINDWESKQCMSHLLEVCSNQLVAHCKCSKFPWILFVVQEVWQEYHQSKPEASPW